MAVSVWDMGDPEPGEEVVSVESMCDIFDDDYGDPRGFERSARMGWKTYLETMGRVYLDWPELLRRFGPVRESDNS